MPRKKAEKTIEYTDIIETQFKDENNNLKLKREFMLRTEDKNGEKYTKVKEEIIND